MMDLLVITRKIKAIPGISPLYQSIKSVTLFRYLYFLLNYLTRPKPSNNINKQINSWKAECQETELRTFFTWGGYTAEKEAQYLLFRDKLILASMDKTVVEIGSYDGNWTKEIMNAKNIICVDLFPEGFEKVKQRVKTEDLKKVSFYHTKGNELNGIKEESIDLVFSVDSLVRAPRKALYAYFQEIHRILKKDGKAMLHIALITDTSSLIGNFTCFFKIELYFLLRKFKTIKFEKVLPHGVILVLEK